MEATSPGDREGHAGGRTGAFLVDVVPQGVDDVEDVVPLALLHGQEGGPLPVGRRPGSPRVRSGR